MFMNRDDLLALLTSPTIPYIVVERGVIGYVVSIEREDGSGYRFNVKVETKQGPRTIYVDTKPR